MHVFHCFRPVIARTMFVVGLATAGLISTAAASSAATPHGGSAQAGSGQVTTIGGLTVTTLAWVVVGFAFLIIGLVAASKSGNRAANKLDRLPMVRSRLSDVQLRATRSGSSVAVDVPAGAAS